MWKTWFSLSLHANFNNNNLWNGCKVFVLWPSKPSNTQFNYWYNFHSLNYKQGTDIFHCPPTFTLFNLFFDIINGIFFESCFCWARGQYKKHIELNLELIISKIDDVIRQILFSWWMLFKSFSNSTLKMVNFVLVKRFRFQPQWKITLSHFYIFFSCFFTWHQLHREEIWKTVCY